MWFAANNLKLLNIGIILLFNFAYKVDLCDTQKIYYLDVSEKSRINGHMVSWNINCSWHVNLRFHSHWFPEDSGKWFRQNVYNNRLLQKGWKGKMSKRIMLIFRLSDIRNKIFSKALFCLTYTIPENGKMCKDTIKYIDVHVVLGSRLRPCKPSALDLTIANTWVRFSSQVRGDSYNSQIT